MAFGAQKEGMAVREKGAKIARAGYAAKLQSVIHYTVVLPLYLPPFFPLPPMKTSTPNATDKTRTAKVATRLLSVRLPVDLVADLDLAVEKKSKLRAWDRTAEIVSRLSKPVIQEAPIRVAYKATYALETKRVSVTIPVAVWDAASSHAAVFKTTTSRWMGDVIQSVAMRPVVLGNDEIIIIRSAIRELSAVGRNLNQITHQINSDAYQRGTIDLKHEAILGAINQIGPRVLMLMRACKALVNVRERAVGIENG